VTEAPETGEFERTTAKWDRYTMLVGLLASLSGPAYLLFVAGFWPGIGPIVAAFVAVAAIFVVYWVLEPVTYSRSSVPTVTRRSCADAAVRTAYLGTARCPTSSACMDDRPSLRVDAPTGATAIAPGLTALRWRAAGAGDRSCVAHRAPAAAGRAPPTGRRLPSSTRSEFRGNGVLARELLGVKRRTLSTQY
jgi:hypothetical protein